MENFAIIMNTVSEINTRQADINNFAYPKRWSFSDKTLLFENASVFLYTYFNFGYYICIVPFRFERIENSEFRLRTSKFQQVS